MEEEAREVEKAINTRLKTFQSLPQNPLFTPKANGVTCILIPTILQQGWKWRQTLQTSRFWGAEWSLKRRKPDFSIHNLNYHTIFPLC